MFKMKESEASKELKIIYKNMSLRNKILASFATCTSIFTLAIGAAVIAIITIQPAHAAGFGPNGVPIYSMFDTGGSGDLSHVTRHSFTTSRIINPKTGSDYARNSSLNSQNGYFRTGSQTYNAAGAYIFTMPSGFTRIKVVGCGAGGLGETRNYWRGVANTGGGGSGSCFIITLTGESGTQFLFKPAAAGGTEPTQISTIPDLLNRLSALGFNGGRGVAPIYSPNSGWIDGLNGSGASLTAGTNATYTNVNAAGGATYQLAQGAKLALAGKSGSGFKGGVSTKRFYNSNYTQTCTGGNGADGVEMGALAAVNAASSGCIMVLW